MTTLAPWLRWLLAATVLLSMFALWWPDDSVHAVRAVATRGAGDPVRDTLAPATVAGSAPIRLPSQLPSHILDKASFDPFVGVQAAAPASPAPPAPVVAVAPPPKPTTPPLDYRYLGRMTDPSGRQFVYLARGSKDVPVAVGTKLGEGYVVESISPDSVRLYYPPLQAHAVIPIPPTRETSPPLVSPAS